MVTLTDNGKPVLMRGSFTQGDYYVKTNKDSVVGEFINGVGFDIVETHVHTTVDSAGVEKFILAEGSAATTLFANRNVVEIVGNSNNNFIYGGSGSSSINGGAGDDLINGGYYADTLIGGVGRDTFQFGDRGEAKASSYAGRWVDTLTDFNRSQGDKIELISDSFKTLKNGLSFKVVDSSVGIDRLAENIVYNQRTGGLYYNPNGAKAGFDSFVREGSTFYADGGGQFATLSNQAQLTSADFSIV